MKISGRVDIRGASRAAVLDIRKVVLEEVADAIREIVRRTESGRDINGRRFVRYTKEYRKFKIRTTGSGQVNLRLSGQMLDSITSKVEVRSTVIVWSIFFSNREAEQKAIWNSVRRPFFGVSRLTYGRIRVRSEALLRYYKRKSEDDAREYAGAKRRKVERESYDSDDSFDGSDLD